MIVLYQGLAGLVLIDSRATVHDTRCQERMATSIINTSAPASSKKETPEATAQPAILVVIIVGPSSGDPSVLGSAA